MMKKALTLLTFFLLCMHTVDAQNKLNFIRLGESNPSISAYIFGTGEQLIGQQFQTEGILTYKGYQYTVYYNQPRNVCIARRKLPFGKWEEVALPYKNNVNDAHNTISMGICHKDGTIHLAYDHHNDDLHYCYSVVGMANDPENIPWEVASFSATTNMMDKAVPNVTYPRFITKPDGNLLFECRFRWSGYGDSYLREYDGDAHSWSLIGRYVQGEDVNGTTVKEDACAYINGMTYDYLGRLHITWVWRDRFDAWSNHDFYYAYSEDDGRTWKDTKGIHVATTEQIDPVYDKLTGSCLGQTKRSLMVEEIPWYRGLINQETQAVDSKGRIHAVNSHMLASEADNSNWSSSRAKARLHHRFRDTDGTWKTALVKKNGQEVNSYCRTNLSFDAFDNAFVVANGAEVYYATDANGYDDWNLMSDVDKGRFLSEPLVDRTLLKKDGVLSFVYLGADNKITVIDYLLDNPNTPSGAGLTAEYFSDDLFSTLINSQENVLPTVASLPTNAKSVRWSGTFETTLAKDYTLHVNTSAATIVYVDGVKVLLTHQTQIAKDYEFTFAPIASHKHNIVIESQATNKDAFSLSWSTPNAQKTIISITALYAEPTHDVPNQGNEDEPELMGKSNLANLLLGAQSITERKIINITPFNPQGDYTVEINAKIISSVGCGLVLEGRVANGKGFRVSLDETKLRWMAPYTKSTLLTVADNREEQIYRFAVKGKMVHIYQQEEYITSVDITEIGDIDDNGNEIAPIPQTTNINLEWAGYENKGSGRPNEYGWDNTVANTGWDIANGGSGVRFLDVTSGHTYSGTTYSGRLLTIRWDGGQGTYSFPITLEANTSYEFSMLYEWWNNGSPNSINAGISKEKNGADLLVIKSMTTAGKNILQKGTLSFTSKDAGTYYLVLTGQSGVMYGIANLELKKYAYQPKLTLSKYCDEISDIQIANLMYEDGAYAPKNQKPDVELEKRETLSQNITGSLQIAGLAESKDIRKFPFDLSGDYSLEIAASITSMQGRGMDLEVRDQQGIGFRTAMNNSEFLCIAPFASSQIISTSTPEEQIIRYAVKNNKVYVFQNGTFVTSFPKQTIGDMNDAGTIEKAPYSNTAINSQKNGIKNPDFQETADNAAPEGWTSNGTLGVSGGARVQLKSSTTELSAYPDGTKAFLVRFDGNYTWFSSGVALSGNTWYEYSFDLVSWGDNVGKTLGFTVSTQEAEYGDIVATQQLITPKIRATGERNVIRFKTNEAGNYYITFSKNGTLSGTTGFTNLCLVEYPLNGILVGKNYTDGVAPINIRYITIDAEGAFAPLKGSSEIVANDADNRVVIYIQDSRLFIESSQDMSNVRINDLSGRMIENRTNCLRNFVSQLATGVYIVSIETVEKEWIIKKVVIY